MPTKNEMTIDERRKYVKLMAERYRKAKRKERSQLLSEMEEVSKLHRKHLLRLLNGKSLERQKRSTPRSRVYGLEVERVVLRVWESLDYVCAERLTPSLVRMAKHLAGFGSLILTTEVESQLATISCATVERMLRRNRARKARLPRTGPHRANQVRHWSADETHPLGHQRAGAFRGGSSAFEHVSQRLPFAIKELHPDNGPEFFNWHLVRYWREKVTGVHLSRSRPYHKNDNRNVEQKNDTRVAAVFRRAAPGYFGASRVRQRAV